MTREIELTQGLVTILDDPDYERLVHHHWMAARNHRGIYAVRGQHPHRVLMHREILAAPSGLQVDHVNGNGLDNRRANLRLAKHSEQQANSALCVRNTSGFKGVSWDGRRRQKCWRVYLQVKRRRLFCGAFYSAEEAARAYDRAAVEHFGPFARTNAMMGLFS